MLWHAWTKGEWPDEPVAGLVAGASTRRRRVVWSAAVNVYGRRSPDYGMNLSVAVIACHASFVHVEGLSNCLAAILGP